MQARGHTWVGSLSRARLAFRWTISTATILLLLFAFTRMVDAQTPSFEIVIPIDTVVSAAEGSVTVLDTTDTPEDLIGEGCRVIAQSENQSSVHPGNDLIVESETSIVLEEVEGEPGGTVIAKDNMVLSDEILISLLMGPDEVFSAGIDVQFDCPPEPTTTTTQPLTTTSDAGDGGGKTTTTTQPLNTTTTDDDEGGNGGATTTTRPLNTTTTMGITDTTEAATNTTRATTTTSPTSTTVEDAELAFTGPEHDGLGLLALTLAATGGLLLVGERSLAYSPMGRSLVLKRCRQCEQGAMFSTPYGRMCFPHTRQALNDDDKLWMPRRLK